MKNTVEFEIDNNKLKLLSSQGEIIINFNFLIRQVIKFDDCFVVRLEPDTGQVYNENVFGISNDGKVLWQIEPMQHVYNDSPYTGLGKEDDLAKLSNWDGTDLIIEPYTGKIIKKNYSR